MEQISVFGIHCVVSLAHRSDPLGTYVAIIYFHPQTFHLLILLINFPVKKKNDIFSEEPYLIKIRTIISCSCCPGGESGFETSCCLCIKTSFPSFNFFLFPSNGK